MTTNDEALAALTELHPSWQIWRVDRLIGGPVWCARPTGQDKPVLNAYRPADLTAQIQAREGGQPPGGHSRPAPYEEALTRMRAVASELSAHGMTTYLHDSHERLDLTATFSPPGKRETELILDDDGYAEVRYWINAAAEPDEITAQALRVMAAVNSSLQDAKPEPASATEPDADGADPGAGTGDGEAGSPG